MRYYKLGETPAYYITAWYKLLSGKWEFGKVHATELGFNTDEPYLASIIGKTVTQITYYTADGVYVLPVSVAL